MAEAETKQEDLSSVVSAGANWSGEEFDTSAMDLGNDILEAAEAEQEVVEPEVQEDTAEEPEGLAAAEEVVEEDVPEQEPEEEVVEVAAEAQVEDKKSEPKIPKARFDEVNERRKAAEARLKQLEKAQEAFDPFKAVEFDFDDAEKKYMEAVLDGETDKALEIRKEIRAAEFTVSQATAAQKAEENRAITHKEIQLKTTIAEIENEIPQLKAGSADYDAELTAEVLDLFEGFKTRGYEPDVALRKAANYVARYNDLGAVAEVSPEPIAPAVPQRSATPEQTRRKLETATRQPPTPSVRNMERDVDLMSMSETEFDKLAADQIARLRGDIL